MNTRRIRRKGNSPYHKHAKRPYRYSGALLALQSALREGASQSRLTELREAHDRVIEGVRAAA